MLVHLPTRKSDTPVDLMDYAIEHLRGAKTLKVNLHPGSFCASITKGEGYAITWNVRLMDSASQLCSIEFASDYGFGADPPHCYVYRSSNGLEMLTYQGSFDAAKGLKSYSLMNLGWWRWKLVGRELVAKQKVEGKLWGGSELFLRPVDDHGSIVTN